MRLRWWVLSAIYVAAVAALAASAFWNPDETFSWGREGVALVLTLPALLPALPVLYLVGAAAWNVTGADAGGPMWPVTLVYALTFAGIAVANVWLLRLLVARLTVARTRRG
ncbi:MAG TPA: hypothetical protein VGN47_03655 [Blastococcus sp.]|jgi:hypothetical protein|nr:hypothetical protein [Blastococcus sp.]